MFEQIKKFLNQPYPDQDDFQSSLKGSIVTGIIVFLVLGLFAPFGIEDAGSNSWIYAGIFGLISCVTSLLVEVSFDRVIKLRRDLPTWTFWKWILSVLFLMMVIACANYIYVIYKFGANSNDFVTMVYSTFVVGIFPVTIFGSYNIIKNLKANQRIAEEVDTETIDSPASANVSLPIKNSAKTFEINPSKILYLESMQNYVQIHYLNDENELQVETHRNTITALAEVLIQTGIKRTHRSYLINPQMIKEVTGNAQGLKLHLAHSEEVVPVSRKYISEFR